jgi:hypothetical protein
VDDQESIQLTTGLPEQALPGIIADSVSLLCVARARPWNAHPRIRERDLFTVREFPDRSVSLSPKDNLRQRNTEPAIFNVCLPTMHRTHSDIEFFSGYGESRRDTLVQLMGVQMNDQRQRVIGEEN